MIRERYGPLGREDVRVFRRCGACAMPWKVGDFAAIISARQVGPDHTTERILDVEHYSCPGTKARARRRRAGANRKSARPRECAGCGHPTRRADAGAAAAGVCPLCMCPAPCHAR